MHLPDLPYTSAGSAFLVFTLAFASTWLYFSALDFQNTILSPHIYLSFLIGCPQPPQKKILLYVWQVTQSICN